MSDGQSGARDPQTDRPAATSHGPDAPSDDGDSLADGPAGALSALLLQVADAPSLAPPAEGAARRADLAPGTVIAGRYRIGPVLGRGGMGVVHEAVQLDLGRKVALKVLAASDLPGDPQRQIRFEREARLAASIAHPSIIQVFEVGRSGNGDPFIAMELLEGRSLRELIDEERLPAGRLLGLIDQLLAALQAAHDRGIVHRDVKAENVFVTRHEQEERVKVLDFGISKLISEDGEGLGLTRTGTLLGTPLYMSPEQASGAAVIDARADLYAVGVLLFRALTGRFPYEASSLNGLVFALASRPAPRLSALLPEAAPALAALVDRALERELTRRFQSASELRRALAALPRAGLSGLTTRLLADGPVPLPGGAAAPARGRGWAVGRIAAATALAAALLGAGGWLWSARAGDAPRPRPIAPPPVLAAIPSAPLPTPRVLPAASTVQVRLRVDPASASVLIDGQPVANPYQGQRPLDRDRFLRVVAVAPGFEREVVQQRLDGDIELHLRLQPAAAVPSEASPPAGPRRPPPRPPAGRPVRMKTVVE